MLSVLRFEKKSVRKDIVVEKNMQKKKMIIITEEGARHVVEMMIDIVIVNVIVGIDMNKDFNISFMFSSFGMQCYFIVGS